MYEDAEKVCGSCYAEPARFYAMIDVVIDGKAVEKAACRTCYDRVRKGGDFIKGPYSKSRERQQKFRELYAQGVSVKEIAEKFGVGQSVVYYAIPKGFTGDIERRWLQSGRISKKEETKKALSEARKKAKK